MTIDSSSAIASAVDRLGPGPLNEADLVEHVHPLFSRVLNRREIYLANHSLGRPLDRAEGDVADAVRAWAREMDGAWTPWFGALQRFRAQVARLIGLSRADAIIPKPGAGQALRAVLNAIPAPKDHQRLRVVASDGEFDSIDTILRTYEERGRASVRWVRSDADEMHDGRRIAQAIDATTDLVVVSLVYFQTGQILDDLAAIVEQSRRIGALVVLDAYHAVGVLPITSFDDLGCDFAIGGSYKYTRGGPGAGWLAIHPRHLIDSPTADTGQKLVTLDTGWFAKRKVFGFSRGDRVERALGGDAWLECTPAVLPCVQALAGLEFTLAIGVDRLRQYSLAQQRSLEESLRSRDVPIHSPEPARRGAFLRVRSDNANALVERLKHSPIGEWTGLNADARAGHIRLCPDLLNTQRELDAAAELIARAMK
jgi:kynureninase